MPKSKIIILSGPSGVGKKTVREKLDYDALNLVNSVSWTTRAPREEDEEGVTYHFATPEEFAAMVDAGGFAEHEGYTENAYGTPQKPLDDWQKEGKNVMVEIEVKGAAELMKKYPDVVTIFLVPPTMDDLKKRLYNRKSESEEKIAKRLKKAESEMPCRCNYQHVVVNDDPQRAADEIANIIAEA